MIPQQIGRYIVRSELGRGGMATVYLARDPNFDREVAIKVLPEVFLHEPQFRTRFEREAKTIAMLEHPAIVPVYDFGEVNDQPYIVMRYMAGGTLADRIERGPLSLDEVSRLITRLAPALDAAHAHGIIHRDLKPGNILYDQYGNAFLSDFGIAHLAAEGLTTLTSGMAIGTPAYMSPEQIQGDKKIDGRSDLYSLGTMVYEMLTGQMPFQSDTPAQMMMMHILQPAPRILDARADLPPSCNFIITKAMAKNPSDRYSTSGELAAALQMAAFNEPAATPAIAMAVNPPGSPVVAATVAVSNPATPIPQGIYAGSPTSPPPGGITLPQPAVKTSRGIPSWLIVLVLVLLLAAAGIGYLGYKGFGPLAMLAPVEKEEEAVQSDASESTAIQPTSIPTAAESLAAPVEEQLTPASNTQATLAISEITPTAILAAAIQPSATIEIIISPTEPPPATPTQAILPTPEPSPTQALAGPVIGGADKLAYINGKEIFIANLDGTGLSQLTSDQSAKSNLQWSPDGQSVHYISGKCINEVNIETNEIRQVVCFNSADTVSAFQISPDGQQVIISIDNQMYIVAYNLEQLSQITSRNQLKNMAACADWAPYTRNLVRDARWSRDGKTLAILMIANLGNGIRGDAIQVIDLTYCVPNPHIYDNFPHPRFDMEGYDENPVIQNFGYDGINIYALNSFVRNDGFGDMYIYNSELYKAYPDVNPVDGKCCYRDTSFSPDGSYLIFAFQDYGQGINSQTYLYLIPYGQVGSGMSVEPLNLPAILDPRERPIPVLRPAK